MRRDIDVSIFYPALHSRPLLLEHADEVSLELGEHPLVVDRLVRLGAIRPRQLDDRLGPRRVLVDEGGEVVHAAVQRDPAVVVRVVRVCVSDDAC